MSTLVVGLLLGAGLFLIWWSCWEGEAGEFPTDADDSRWARLGDDVVQAGLTGITVRTFLLACALLGLTVLLVVGSVSGAPAVAACFGAMAGYAPVAVVRARARSARKALRDIWPDVVDNVASGVRAGLSLPEALAQLATRGPEPLRPHFAAFAADYRASGRFNDSLDLLKERLSNPVGDRLVESLRLARQVGGTDLGRLLRTLSAFLREDARRRAEMETRQGWTVNAAKLAVAAPWIVLATMITRPDAMESFTTGSGTVVLVVGAVVSVVAYRLMLRIGHLPEEQRVLR